MSKLNLRRCGYALGAEITGVDLSELLDDETVAEIRQACLDNVVLVFPGQNLQPAQLRAFTARFGDLFDYPGALKRDDAMPEVLELVNRPNVIDGKPGSGATLAVTWHTDFSYGVHPASLSFLLSKRLPTVGGNTGFANTYLAYETLSPAFKEMIEPLEAVHDYTYGHAFKQSAGTERAKMATIKTPAVHRLVRIHQETGRKALFFSGRVRNFIGMTEEESQPIVAFLEQHTTRYEFVYRHAWKLNDLVMWDQRGSMHKAIQDYDQRELRMMLRTSVKGPKSGHLLSEKVAVAS